MARQPTFAVHISLTLSLKNVYSDLAERLLTYQIRHSSPGHAYTVVIVWQRGVILAQTHTQRVLSEASGHWRAEVPNSYAWFSTPSFPPFAVLANGTAVTVSAMCGHAA